MLIDVSAADPLSVYRVLIGAVTPRPIAWVTTLDREGHVNLAPFSFFNAFGAKPPVVVFSPVIGRNGKRKDTLNNVEATREFVLNAAVASLAEAVNATSKELPPGESEVELAGLSLTPSVKVKPPRVAESPVHLECVLRQILPVGDGPMSANLVIGEVVMLHVAEHVLDDKGQIDPRKLATIGRMGGEDYCHTSDLFALKRP
jgi:flavin reductase (DIM6/NTAB) family NADH-FMN oxidoreductase RutF